MWNIIFGRFDTFKKIFEIDRSSSDVKLCFGPFQTSNFTSTEFNENEDSLIVLRRTLFYANISIIHRIQEEQRFNPFFNNLKSSFVC